MVRQGRFSLVFLSLLALLVFQLGLAARKESRPDARKRPLPRVQATWAYLAPNLSVATNLSREIVLARVVQVQAGPDLGSCAQEDDQIAANLISLAVEQVYKGNPSSIITLFQTAPIIDVKEDTLNQPRGTLVDDPPYATGERYLLFLRDGPMVGTIPTKVMLAPEGRYRVNSGILEALTSRGFARAMAGRPLSAFVQELMQLDTDRDGIPDRIDNCPTCSNPSQNLPPWPVPPDDPDCDGFSTRVDDFTGGLPLAACANTPMPGDETRDAWPPDLNDDQRVDGADAMIMQPFLGAVDVSDCDTIPDDGRYNHRMDLNADFRINTVDAGILQSFMGRSCLFCLGTTDAGAPPVAGAGGLMLSQNEPNPFDPAARAATRIEFEVPASAGAGVRTTLRIYDSTGRLVRTLVDAVLQPADHFADWDGRDEAGRLVPAGVYFFRLEAGGAAASKKMVVLSTRR